VRFPRGEREDGEINSRWGCFAAVVGRLPKITILENQRIAPAPPKSLASFPPKYVEYSYSYHEINRHETSAKYSRIIKKRVSMNEIFCIAPVTNRFWP
jgi:hypothetical protein